MSLSTQVRGVKPRILTRSEALIVWANVVRLAVSGNSYDQVLKERVLLSLDKGDYADLVELSGFLVHTEYASAAEHFRAHQLSNLIRKYPDLPGLDVDPRLAAIATFESAEWRCRWTNRRLALVRDRDVQPHAVKRGEAQKYIRYVLRDGKHQGPEGPTCDFPYDELWSECDFTGGASIGVGGSSTHLYAKLAQGISDKWTVGSRAFQYAARALWSNDHTRELISPTARFAGSLFEGAEKREFCSRLKSMVRLVSYNRVGFVPKTALTYRSIAVEPTLNTFLQKGVDKILRKCLRRVGLDLGDQTPNQLMAALGSLEWDSDDPYCTIDLSSASDTLCIMCARDLLPEEWFAVMDDLRSRYREDGKGVKLYEKFVTMGNGFCFPLQTLIFSSLCVAAYAAQGRVPDFRVYGDDIIVRKSVFGDVLELLKFYGFKPNERKTFGSGPFRESCGGDYYKGTNVRPIIFDSPLDEIQKMFGFHNQTLRSPCTYVKDYFEDIRDYMFRFVHEDLRYVSSTDPSYTVSGETVDGAFWVNQDVAMFSRFTRWNRKTQSLSYVRLQALPVDDQHVSSASPKWGLALLMAVLRGGSSSTPFSLRYQTRYVPRIVNPEREYGVQKVGTWWEVEKPQTVQMALFV
jgi:hypothetical protein